MTPTKPWLLAEPPPREGLAFAMLLAFLAALPVLVASQPQMADYAAHLARYHVMIEQGHNPVLDQYYGFEWKWTGNLGVDLLIRPLAALFGLEAAGRIVCAAIPVLTGLGFAAAEWSLRRRAGLGAVFAMAFIWNPALLMGFLNFALAFALALFAFALWVWLKEWRWRPALFVPVGLAVWLCHASGWGILGIMVFGYEWSRDKSWRAFLAPWPLLAPLVPMLSGGNAAGDMLWGRNVLAYKQAIWKKAMRDTSEWLDIATAALPLLALAPALIWPRFFGRLDGRLAWAGMALLVLSLVMPRHIVGGDYADYRLIAAGLALLALAIQRPSSRLVLLLASSLFLTRLSLTTFIWHRQSAELEQDLAVLDHLPHGARVASAVLTIRTEWPSNPFEHVGAWATVRRDALTNANFALPKVHMLRLKHPPPYRFIDPSQRLLQMPAEPVDLAAFAPAGNADYLWYRGDKAPHPLPAGAELIFRTEHSLLLRLAKPGPHR
jgi:hypothetical protein